MSLFVSGVALAWYRRDASDSTRGEVGELSGELPKVAKPMNGSPRTNPTTIGWQQDWLERMLSLVFLPATNPIPSIRLSPTF